MARARGTALHPRLHACCVGVALTIAALTVTHFTNAFALDRSQTTEATISQVTTVPISAEPKKASEDPTILYYLGLIYNYGIGVPLNQPLAITSWLQASEHLPQKDAVESLVQLGLNYYNGWGVLQDYQQARIYFERAAAFGDPTAYFALGNLFDLGLGVSKDYENARSLYLKAHEVWNAEALLGSAVAQHYLAHLYWRGLGVAQDPSAAETHFKEAAALGFTPALHGLAKLYEAGCGDVPNDSRAEMAHQYLAEAAKAGFAPSAYNLGKVYSHNKEDREAVQWFATAAYQGYPEAQRELGLSYKDAKGVQRDDVLALAWLTQAAQQGDQTAGIAQHELAVSLAPSELELSQAIVARRRAPEPSVLHPSCVTLFWPAADPLKPVGQLATCDERPSTDHNP